MARKREKDGIPGVYLRGRRTSGWLVSSPISPELELK